MSRGIQKWEFQFQNIGFITAILHTQILVLSLQYNQHSVQCSQVMACEVMYSQNMESNV